MRRKGNTTRSGLDGAVVEIVLENSDRVAIIDAADAALVTAHTWHWNAPNGCVATNVPDANYKGRQRTLKLHRLVMGAVNGDGREIHHRDRDPFNNRKQNLIVTVQAVHSAAHRIEQPPRRSGLKGVVYHRGWEDRGWKPWEARLEVNGKKKSLGCFVSEEAAGRAYDRAVREVYGSIPGLKPYVNFPEAQV